MTETVTAVGMWAVVGYLVIGLLYVVYLWVRDLMSPPRHQLPDDIEIIRESKLSVAIDKMKMFSYAVVIWPWIVNGNREDAKLRRAGKQVGGRHS
jgi:hypothetical protein